MCGIARWRRPPTTLKLSSSWSPMTSRASCSRSTPNSSPPWSTNSPRWSTRKWLNCPSNSEIIAPVRLAFSASAETPGKSTKPQQTNLPHTFLNSEVSRMRAVWLFSVDWPVRVIIEQAVSIRSEHKVYCRLVWCVWKVKSMFADIVK